MADQIAEIPVVTVSKLDPQALLEEFVQDCRDRHLTEETIAKYKSPLRIFVSFCKGRGVDLAHVDRHVLKEFIHYRRNDGGKDGDGVDQKTLENNFSALSTFYDFLSFEGYVCNNPILPVRRRYLTRYKEEDEDDESPRKLISIEEMAMLINSILSIRDKGVVTVLAKTEVRRGELISMEIDDINWVEGSTTLKRKKFKKRSNRIGFFDDETTRILKRWVALREKMKPRTRALFVGEHDRRQYTKIHGLFNLEARTVEAFEATEGTAHECRHLEGLLSKLENIECLVADPAYLSRQNCMLVAEKGGKPYIKPKKNSQMKAKGCWPWKDMLTLFRRHQSIFNRFYRLRQRIEAGWHSLKSIVGDITRNRTIQTIKTEIWSKIICYNLIRTVRGSHKF